jgi:hypothetical protein
MAVARSRGALAAEPKGEVKRCYGKCSRFFIATIMDGQTPWQPMFSAFLQNTHALFAQEVERNVSNIVAHLPPGGSSSDRAGRQPEGIQLTDRGS